MSFGTGAPSGIVPGGYERVMTLYKVVDTPDGPSIAHLRLPDDAATVEPDADDSRLRADRLLVEYIENLTRTAWGPVDQRTVYSIGEVTRADALETDESVVSGAGLYAFKERDDAVAWMEQAEIE